MTSSDRSVAADLAPAGPLRSVPGGRIDDLLVLDVLARLVGAETCEQVAAAPLPLLLDLPGVRATAVVLREAARVVVAASAGYDCDAFDAGAALPLDAGLPVTEAVRTGRTVVRGTGPSWVAVPFPRSRGGCGALLLSLSGAPPRAPVELARLQRVARALADAFDRAAGHDRLRAAVAEASARLAPSVVDAPGWDTAIRSMPHDRSGGGDTLLCLPDGRGGTWLLAADVCGFGLAAAVVAQAVQASLLALATQVETPAALLAAADRVLRPMVGSGLFVTAVAVHVRDGVVAVSSAGHPPPVLVTPAGARLLDVQPGLPLALEGHVWSPRGTTSVPMTPEGVLVLHTDGLVDRRTPTGPRSVDVLALVGGHPLDDLEVLVDSVLAAAEQAGQAGDDVSLMAARPRH